MGHSAYVDSHQSSGGISQNMIIRFQLLNPSEITALSIGRTAYPTMVEMALGFQNTCLYTVITENDR